MTSDRSGFCVDWETPDLDRAPSIVSSILDLLLPRIHTVWIDAYSDASDLPPAAAKAQSWLVEQGKSRRRGDPRMGIEVDRYDPEALEVLRCFAPWSINVESYDENMHWVAELSDTSHAICFNVSVEELDQLRHLLPEVPIAALQPGRRRS
jgi:hypothetical protein